MLNGRLQQFVPTFRAAHQLARTLDRRIFVFEHYTGISMGSTEPDLRTYKEYFEITVDGLVWRHAIEGRGATRECRCEVEGRL